MIAIAVTELTAELESAISGGSPERRVQVLQQITHLFLSIAGRLDERQIAIFDDVLLRLIARAEPAPLTWLSTVLSDLTAVPTNVVRRLARHEEPTVAAPVLLKSEALSESDLIEIANHRGQQHLLAISERKTLDEALTDVLLKRGDTTVCRALAGNAGARFSDQGWRKLAIAAERDDDIADALVVRRSLPVKVLRDLLAGATKASQARHLKTAPPQTRETLRGVIESIPAGASPKAHEPTDYSESKSRALALSHAGQLNNSAVNRFAVHGQRTNLVAALSLLADAAIETIAPLFEEADSYGLIVACRASRLDWQTTLAVINSRSHAKRLTQEEIEEGKELFDALFLSIAQRTIRFGSAGDLAKPGLTGNTSAAARAI